jgi:hypothetical protein
LALVHFAFNTQENLMGKHRHQKEKKGLINVVMISSRWGKPQVE